MRCSHLELNKKYLKIILAMNLNHVCRKTQENNPTVLDVDDYHPQ